MKRTPLLLLLVGTLFLLSSCLTSEYKEYNLKFDSKGAGILTITYINIFSDISDDEDIDSTLTDDYNELMNKYIDGDEIEKDFPNAKFVSKKLFERNGQLCGEVVLKFDKLFDVNIFQYDKKSPFMYYLTGTEEFFESNGSNPVKDMPIVFWDKKVFKTGNFQLTTLISEMGDKDTSLLNKWKTSN